MAETRTSLRDYQDELLSRQAQRNALIERDGSVIEPYEPTLTDRFSNFVYDMSMRFGGDRGSALRRARMAEDTIGVTPLQGITDLQTAKRLYSEGDKVGGDISLMQAASTLFPGNERPLVNALDDTLDMVRKSWPFPDNISWDELMSPETLQELPGGVKNLVKALWREDGLGFDTPAQAISTVLSEDAVNYDISPQLKSAVTKLTRNSGDIMPTSPSAPQTDVPVVRNAPDTEGWDTENIFLHGTSSDFDDSFRASLSGDLGPGFYTTGPLLNDSGDINRVMNRSGKLESMPETAERYANIRKFMKPEQRGNGAPNTRPVVFRDDLNFLDVEGGMLGPSSDERVSALRKQGYDGIRVTDPETGNISQINVFDPENVRSAFDFGIPLAGPTNPQVGVQGVAGETSGLALSGRPIIQTARAGERIEIPVMDLLNEKGFSTNPLMANIDLSTRPDNISPGTFNRRVDEFLNNPAINQLETSRLLGGVVTYPEDTFLQSAKYEDFLGMPVIPLPADTTTRGIVSRVAGIDIDPYLVEGGPRHLDKWDNWMSMEPAAKAKQAHANRVREETGLDPIYIHMAMDDRGSNFSESASQVALRYVDAVGGLTPKGRKILDDKMKSWPNKGDKKGIAESWPGYEDPEQILTWLNDNSGSPSAGNRRKAFAAALDMKALEGEGAPIMNDVYSIINDPELRGAPAGMTGYRAMVSADVNPLSLERNTDMNTSYDTIIPGTQSLIIDEPRVPYNIMFRDMVNARSSRQSPYRSVQVSGGSKDYQMFDDSILEAITNYTSSLRRQRGE